MHRFQSPSTIARFRYTSLLLCFKYIVAPVALALLGYSIFQHNRDLTYLAIGLGGLAVLVAILQWIVGAKTRCPLCMTPVMAANGCSKNRKARKLLGSYRLRVATSVVFKGWFRCPYCNEPSVLETRTKNR
jgi:cytochrome bd-type quinol oxidase subunit 1